MLSPEENHNRRLARATRYRAANRPTINAKQNARRKKNRRLFRDYGLKHHYGLVIGGFKKLVKRQNGVCAICGKPETHRRLGKLRALCVDHHHSTNQIRGLLCTACNAGLGYFREDPKILQAAVAYLETQTENINEILLLTESGVAGRGRG